MIKTVLDLMRKDNIRLNELDKDMRKRIIKIYLIIGFYYELHPDLQR
jgi:hypothetical protein